MTAFKEGDGMSMIIYRGARFLSGVEGCSTGNYRAHTIRCESTHTLQGVFEVFVRSNLQADIPPLKIH